MLYIFNNKDEGNTLKPYLPEMKTAVVLKVFLLECAWVPGLVHPSMLSAVKAGSVFFWTNLYKCAHASTRATAFI